MSCPVCDYKDAKEERYLENLKPNKRFIVVFMVTDECNFRCTYCFEKNKHSTFMSKEIAKTFIDKMFDFKDYKDYWGSYYNEEDDIEYITFQFFGGEPFLNIELMDFIISYFTFKCNEDLSKYKNRLEHFDFNIITNGSLLKTPKAQEFLDKYIDKGSINITFEGVKEYHDSCRFFKNTKQGTFDTVYENVKWYKERYNKSIRSKITITPDNVKYMYQCYCYLKELGENNCYMKFQDDTKDWNEEHERIADAQYKLIVNDLLQHPEMHFSSFIIDKPSINRILYSGCGVGRNYITVESNGDLYPCYRFSDITVSNDIANEHLIGNYKDGIFKKSDAVFQKVWRAKSKKKYIDHDCLTCVLSKNCNECFASNLEFNGDYDESIKYSCKMQKLEHKWALIYNYYREIGKNEID